MIPFRSPSRLSRCSESSDETLAYPNSWPACHMPLIGLIFKRRCGEHGPVANNFKRSFEFKDSAESRCSRAKAKRSTTLASLSLWECSKKVAYECKCCKHWQASNP